MEVTDKCSNTGEIMRIESRGGRTPFCWNGGMGLGAKGEAPELVTSGFSPTTEDDRVILGKISDDGFSYRGRLPGSIITDRLFSETIPFSPLGSMSISISSLLLHSCLRCVGPCLLPIHSCELDISIIMWYQNSVPSIFTQLHVFHVYFW